MIIVKVPGLNNLNRNNGCRNAGNAIIENLKEVYSSEDGKIIDKKFLNIEEIHADNENLGEQEKLIYKNSKEILEDNDRAVFLGGDHSISFPIGRAFSDYCRNIEKEPCLIVFDAHADCCKPGKEPTHEEWLRALIENGFPKENVLLVGIRNLWRDELVFLSKNKIKKIGIDELSNNIEDVTDTIMEFGSGKDKELYVSIDIDAADPVFAPSTGYKEVGGLSSRQILYIIKRLSKIKNLKAVDIVEINSEDDRKTGNLTVKLGSRLLAELL